MLPTVVGLGIISVLFYRNKQEILPKPAPLTQDPPLPPPAPGP
jgi:hypothetical protein